MGFPGSSNGKKPICNVGDRGSIPESGRSLEKGMATHCSILAWSIPWTEQPGRLQPMGSQRVRHDWSDLACTHTGNMYIILTFQACLSSEQNHQSIENNFFSQPANDLNVDEREESVQFPHKPHGWGRLVGNRHYIQSSSPGKTKTSISPTTKTRNKQWRSIEATCSTKWHPSPMLGDKGVANPKSSSEMVPLTELLPSGWGFTSVL